MWEGEEKKKTASYSCTSVYLDEGSLFVFILCSHRRVSRNAPLIHSRGTGALAKNPLMANLFLSVR